MTTDCLELTSFIDPSLTWKTISKGRNTSRRSRRSVSKNMKMGQEQEKRSSERSSSLQYSESEKANISIHGQRFAGNMEQIPIKKRRLFCKSPSPPLQSPNRQEESDRLVSGQCTSDQRTCSNITTESQDMQSYFSNGSISKNSNSDGNIDKNSVKSSTEMSVSGEDFSGISILAAAACSDRLDYSTNDVVKSQVQGDDIFTILDRGQHESFASASEVKEGITSSKSSDLLGKDAEVKGLFMVSLLKDSVQAVSVNNEADDAGMSPIKEFQNVEQNEAVASTSVHREIVECLLPNSLRSDVDASKEFPADLPNGGANKTSENSGAKCDNRLHWDLNTVMDEWGNPLDDTCFHSGTPLVEAAPVNARGSKYVVEGSEGKRYEIQKLKDVEDLEAKRSKSTEGGDKFTCEAKVCAGPDSGAFQDDADSTSGILTFGRTGQRSEVSSGFVTSILKDKFSPSNVSNHVSESLVCGTNSEIQLEMVNEDGDIDHSLSLGSKGTKTTASEETINIAGIENISEVAKEAFCAAMQNIQSEDREICFFLASASGKAFSMVRDADCKHVEDITVRNDLHVNDNRVADVTCGPTTSSNCEIPALGGSESEKVSCEVNDLSCKDPEQYEDFSVQPLEYRSSMAELEAPSVSICVSKIEDMVTTSMNMDNDQAMCRVIAKEIEENHTVTDTSESDLLKDHESETLMPKMLDHRVSANACIEPTNRHLAVKSLGGGCGSHVSYDVSSQVTKNAGTVNGKEGGYDSHLEDGELRESHCWVDNEGEDLVGECEPDICRSDNFSSVDDQPNLDKIVEENCSLQVQGCLSSVDATEAECTKREISTLKACSGENNSDKIEIDRKDCRSSIEIDSIGIDFDKDPARNASGNSSSGRHLQFSDRRRFDSMRRSRSINFDSMHHTDAPDEILNRSQRPLMRMGQFGGRSWNPEMKSIVANADSEGDGDRIFRTSGDTSPFRGRRPRIIDTSRSGDHFVRRASPVERDSDYGMGLRKTRDMNLNNPRSRFGRFNGINRGFREGYRRSGIYEGPKSGGGGPMLNRFCKQERSFSPVGERFHRLSRSRSRTRSPDFRSEARMGRGRPPYQQANHVADQTRERRSPVRVCNQNQRYGVVGSPGRLRSDDCIKSSMHSMRFHDTTTTSGRDHDFGENDDCRRRPLLMRNRSSRSRSRSCSPDFRSDARMGSMRVPYQPSADHIRDRRSSPVRVFRPEQRFEVGASPVRLRSDECLRPMTRPPRSLDTAQPRRGHEYNNNNNSIQNNSNRDEYVRKPRNIFERIHPIRQYDDVEDEDPAPTQNFRRNENYARAGERRPMEFREPREERGNIRYNNSERMFYSGPKQQFGGMRNYGEDGVPRRVRP
ncbi:uncharacterized protein LOC104888388 isoform X3 [Beta vulgaris subsp. vulgaris]|uniref:uncharacterized protein LOC104888388 isoform X3 n=1 Tax=Beta vulgaris subsp. vulgaris TaxID=3555 RepID=UPI00203740BE|nr:uncharacterized protein LOC104888388 isoform X3 [Beta vulgaris subsp. vulgaris]